MTNDQRGGGNVFQLYSGKGSWSGQTNDAAHYYAFGLERSGNERGEEEWIYIDLGPRIGAAHMIRYDNIQRIYSPDLELVTLTLHDEAFFIHGRLAERILLPIQMRRLRSLYLFDPDFHREPPLGETRITRIDRFTREEFERGIKPPPL